MINYNKIIFYDFETGSTDPQRTQPIELAAIAIDCQKLEIVKDSEFCSLIKPLSDEDAIKAGLDIIQDEALAVNKKTREELANAPPLKIVWEQFKSYVDSFNYKKSNWTAPYQAGFNILKFDSLIINRICREEGPYDEKWNCQKLFHQTITYDLYQIMPFWFDSCDEPKKIGMDGLRDFFSLSTENAHSALVDVQQGAELLIRFMKLHRKLSKGIQWKKPVLT